MIKKLYSQAGQDSWVVQNVFNYMKGGFFLDVGAYDGINLSNTYYLEKNLQWTGLCIEADPNTFRVLKKNRRCKCVNACVGEDGKEIEFSFDHGVFSGIHQGENDNQPHSTVVTKSMGKILLENNAPNKIDYISIDVEGMELKVLESFPFKSHYFLSATIERPCEAARQLLKKEGYLLVADQPGLDAFYIHPEIRNYYLIDIMKRAKYDTGGVFSKINEERKILFQRGLRAYLSRL